MPTMPEIGDDVLVRCRTAAFAAVVRDVTRAAGRSARTVVVRPIDIVPKREFPAGEGVIINDAAGKSWRGIVGGSTDSAVALVLHATQDSAANMSTYRAHLVSIAKLANRFKKFDEMFFCVKAISNLHLDLTQEELELAACCFKSLMKKNTTILKDLRLEFPVRAVLEFREYIEHLLQKGCNDCIMLIEDHLVPFSSIENRAIYYKLIADLALVCYDFSSDDNDDMLLKAVNSYEFGLDIMKSCDFPSDNISLLELILNLSTLLYDKLHSHERAYYLSKEAVTATSAELLSLESKTVLGMILENLRAWSSNVPSLAISECHQFHQEETKADDVAPHPFGVDQTADDPLAVLHNAEDLHKEAHVESAPVHANENDALQQNKPANELDQQVLHDHEDANKDLHKEAHVESAPVHANENDALQQNKPANELDQQVLHDHEDANKDLHKEAHVESAPVHANENDALQQNKPANELDQQVLHDHEDANKDLLQDQAHVEAAPAHEDENNGLIQNEVDIEAAPVDDNANQALQQNEPANEFDQQVLHVHEDANEAPNKPPVPFEAPPMDLELGRTGNTFHGKSYRIERKKKSADRGRFG